MLASLLAWIYITFLCWAWGLLFFQLIKRITKKEFSTSSFEFSVICLAGLSMITIVSGILSLVLPLGEWWIQFIFIIPAISIFFIRTDQYFFVSLKREFSLLHPSSLILSLSLLLMILVMSSWKIVHPDTLGYHAQTMQWIEKYKAVPGLVNLNPRFGYQGLWFVVSALFDFSFLGEQGITFLNSTVLFWFLVFIIKRIDQNFFKDDKILIGIFWLCLLAISLWSYTQARLTVTSASPDFIVTIFILSIIYILLNNETRVPSIDDWVLVSLLSIVSVTIKISAAPILLIPIAGSTVFLLKRKLKAFIICLGIGLLAFSGFIARNIITSGHIIFPSTIMDIIDADWKYSNELTTHEKNYITAYAKKYGVDTKEEVDKVNNERLVEWIPDWWNNRSAADKMIIVFYLISLFTSLLFLKRFIDGGFIPLLLLSTMLTGTIFWFANAPDPRFGYGFILGMIAITSFIILNKRKIHLSKNILVIMTSTFAVFIIVYTGYRFKNFFNKDQLITPLGILKTEFTTFDCDGKKMNSPINTDFGSTPIPCTDLDCNSFSPRGNLIEDGFKPRSNP